jgi:hypothetical protein
VVSTTYLGQNTFYRHDFEFCPVGFIGNDYVSVFVNLNNYMRQLLNRPQLQVQVYHSAISFMRFYETAAQNCVPR